MHSVETKAQAAVTDTVKHRLEQLDDFEEVGVAMVIQCVVQQVTNRAQ